MTERCQTTNLYDAAIGILRETELVVEPAGIHGKDWTKKE